MMSSCALTLTVNATGNPVGSKVGEAKATGYLGILFLTRMQVLETQLKMEELLKFQQLALSKLTCLI